MYSLGEFEFRNRDIINSKKVTLKVDFMQGKISKNERSERGGGLNY